MKNFILLLALFLGLFLNANANEALSKKELLLQANDGNITAMIALEKRYHFWQTKEGLALYKQWYKLVLEQNDAEQITEFAILFKTYQDMFINPELKYQKLLETAKDKGSKKVLFELLKYYDKTAIGNEVLKKKYAKVVQELLKDSSKENLETFSKLAKKLYKHDLYKKIQTLMVQKGYLKSKSENLKELRAAYKSSKYKGYDAKRLPTIVEKIIASQNTDDMYQASVIIKHREHKLREQLLQSILTQTDDKTFIARVNFDLADNLQRRNKQIFKIKKYLLKEKKLVKSSEEKNKLALRLEALEQELKNNSKEKLLAFYEQASTRGHFQATKELFYRYKSKAKYAAAYSELFKRLRSSEKGLRFYLKQFPYDIELFDSLAKKGHKDVILRLAKQNLNNQDPQFEAIAYKWRQYILNSTDYQLHLDMKKILTSSTYKVAKKAQSFLKKLEEKEAKWENILLQRALAKAFKQKRQYQKYEEALALAHRYGDVKSALTLASERVSKASAWSYAKNPKSAKKEALSGIALYKELAAQDEIQALNALAKLYASKSFMAKELFNEQKSLDLYKRASNLGDEEASLKAIALYNCKSCTFYNEQEAIKILEMLVKRGTKPSYAKKLGKIYYKKGPLQNLQKAKEYFEKAGAFYYLTKLYSDKDGIKKDATKAFAYVQKCANLYSPHFACNYLLGSFYLKGFGVQKDETKAITYLHSASHSLAKEPKAALLLGSVYEEKKEYQRAVKLYIRVSKYYRTQTLTRLQALMKKGFVAKEVFKDLSDFYTQMYNVRFSKGRARQAATCLGFMYENGIGVIKDENLAKEWYKKAKEV